MPIITNYVASGHEGDFTYLDPETNISVAGKVSTDADDNLVTVSGSCSKQIEGANTVIGSFSLFFSNANFSIQDNLVDALDATVTALYNDLHPVQSS